MNVLRLGLLITYSTMIGMLFASEGPREKTLLEEKAEAAHKEQEQKQKEERQQLEEELKLHEHQQKKDMKLERRVNLSELEKQKKDVLNIVNQFEDAYKRYAAGHDQEGIVALRKIDGNELLAALSTEQLSSAVSALKPQAEARFMMLKQLADVNARQGNVLSDRPTLVRLIAGLVGSLTPRDLQAVLADKNMVQTFAFIVDQLKSLVAIPVQVLPKTPAEELFYEMVSLGQHLVTVIKLVPYQRKADMVGSLLRLIKSVPKGSSLRLLSAALQEVPVRFLPRDYDSVRELLPLFVDANVSNSLDASALLDMKEIMLQGARKEGSLIALREALRFAGSEETASSLFKYSVDAQDDYLKLMATQSGLRQITNIDPVLMVNALVGLTAKNPRLAAGYFDYLLRNLPILIKTLGAESTGHDVNQVRKNLLEARVDYLTELYEQLPALIIPDYKLSEALWKSIVDDIKKSGETLQPAFFEWKPERFALFLFGTPEEKSSDVVVAIKRFMEVYKFYADFPAIQKQLFDNARKHFSKVFTKEEWNQLLEAAGYDEALLRFMYSDTGRTLFGSNSIDNFMSDLRKRALYKALANDRRPLLNLLSLAYQLSDIVKTLLSYKEGHDILYKLLADVPDNQFSVFLHDIKKNTVFGLNNLPVILKAVPYLQSERAKQLIDAVESAKDEFYYAEHLKPLEQWSDFSVTRDMFDEATAAYKKNLKQEQEKAKKMAVAKQ